MKKYILFFILFLIGGCVSIPKTTYEVSEIIGDGIKSNEKSYLNLVDKYFEEKRQKIDLWVVRVYFPRLIKNVKKGLAESNMSTLLTENQYEDIVEAVIEERDKMQLELEKTRVKVVEIVRANYSELIRVNSELTSLLKSSSELKESLEEKINETTGLKFDFDEFDKSFNEYLDTTDDVTSKTKKLSEKVGEYIK